MADDLKDKGPTDRTRINIHESWELEYWSKHLGVSKEKIISAVKSVGVMVTDVKRHLGV